MEQDFNTGFDEKKLIVIADDDNENQIYMSNVLRRKGFEVITASNGAEAIEITRLRVPDLILLDISMPDMNGFEACTLLRSSGRTKCVPVIFITAMNDGENIARCFECGGNDYISKPVRKEELIPRVCHQIELKYNKVRILRQNRELKRLNSDKNEFMRIAVHDLKNPLYTSLGFIQYIEKKISTHTEEEIHEILKYARLGIEECLQIIHDLLEISAIEDGRLKFQFDIFSLNDIIRNTILKNQINATEKKLTINYNSDPQDITIHTDVSKVQQVLDNVLSNAIKFSPENKQIWIRSKKSNNNASIEITDEGPGIKEEEKELLFTKFSKLSARPTGNESSTGLGLSIAKLLTEKLSGRIYCQSEEGKGATFTVELPLNLENCTETL